MAKNSKILPQKFSEVKFIEWELCLKKNHKRGFNLPFLPFCVQPISSDMAWIGQRPVVRHADVGHCKMEELWVQVNKK